MNLHKAEKGEYKAIKELYVSAFPNNERAPFCFIKRRATQNRATMLAAEDNGEFVGFAYTVCHNDLVYLFYFAVAENKRGNGNGSEILRLLKDYYKDKTIFLAREPLDDNAKNNKERINRRNFYLRNSYIDLPFQIREASVVYDLMSTNEKFNPFDYNVLIKNWAGRIVLALIKMEIAEQ